MSLDNVKIKFWEFIYTYFFFWPDILQKNIHQKKKGRSEKQQINWHWPNFVPRVVLVNSLQFSYYHTTVM